MPLTGILELSSLNERQSGELISELQRHKYTPRPVRITHRSRSACLRLGEAQRPHSMHARKAQRPHGITAEDTDFICVCTAELFFPVPRLPGR